MYNGAPFSHPGGHIDLVPFRVGQRPPGWGVPVTHQVSVRGDGRGDTRLRLVVRHGDVDMDAIALGARRVHLLVPDCRPMGVGVDQVFVAHLLVAEDGAPEGPHCRGDQRVDRQVDLLDRGRVGGYAQFPRRRGDLTGQFDLALTHAAEGVQPQANGHALGPQIDIRGVVRGAGSLPLAATRETPTANDPVLKYVHAPLKNRRNRQSSTPVASWN